MITKSSFNFAILLILILNAVSNPKDANLYMPITIKKAYDNQTRSYDGAPATSYWQNSADYKIKIELEPKSKTVFGNIHIVYQNNSPDTLNELYLHLYPNFFKKGHTRDIPISVEDISNGVKISSISINGESIDTSIENEYFVLDRTLLKIVLNSPLLPKSSIQSSISWNYIINTKTYERTGTADSSSYFIAYFYPRVAVYDDIDGWNEYQYTGNVEFYHDYGDYEVDIVVPENFLVWATGTLQNPMDVLQDKYFQRWKQANKSDKIIHIVDSTDTDFSNITKQNGKNTWTFKAQNVPDFAFATSDHYLWDASSLIVDGQSVLIEAAFNKNSQDFYKVAMIARDVIDYASHQFPGIPYPYPKMTVFNGAKGGMEYPMMVNNGSVYRSGMEDFKNKEKYLICLTAHEIFHTYLPFYVGANEIKYAWMDEGWATFADFRFGNRNGDGKTFSESWRNGDQYIREGQYKSLLGSEFDLPIFGPSKIFKLPTYRINSYPKVAVFNMVLQDLIGKEKLKNVLQEFIIRWNGKHPIPYDFFNTLNEVAGEDLNWLIKPWFFEFGYPDLAITKVEKKSDKYLINIKRLGNTPIPIHIKLTFDDNTTKNLHESVSAWKSRSTQYQMNLNTNKKIIKVELGDELMPDADLSNNVFVLE